LILACHCLPNLLRSVVTVIVPMCLSRLNRVFSAMRPVIRRFAFFLVITVIVAGSLPWAKSQARTFEPSAAFEQGLSAYKAGRNQEALKIWRPLAESGDALAQYSLGKHFETGGGGEAPDLREAARWYELAAQQDMSAAQNNLGLMFAQGRGVPRDPARAAQLWSRSANANNPMAQYNLGLAYFRGDGIGQDQIEAAVWFHMAAAAGLGEAQFALGQMHLKGLALPKDDRRALYWYERAARTGHADAGAQAQRLRAQGIRTAETIDPRLTELLQQGEPSGGTAPVASQDKPPAKAPSSPDNRGDDQLESRLIRPEEVAGSSRAPAQAPISSSMDGTSGALLWLLSSRDEASARELLRDAEQDYAAALDGKPLSLVRERADGSGSFIRLVVETVSREQASETCARIREISPQAFCSILVR
jgi:TPR repeat protein